MRKLLLITTAITGFTAHDAQSGPVVGAVGFLFGGAGFGAVTSIWGIAAGTLGFTALTAAIRIAGSMLLSSAAQALMKPRQQDLLRELQLPNNLPPYRFVYGKCWAPGSPAPIRVKGDILYGCWILNSRPSAGPFTVLLDKRPVTSSGDPYNFAGTGAAATNAPFTGLCKFWIGRGDQLGPPAQILSEAPESFDATDAWRGRTVIWMRLDIGKNKTRQERWPSVPPEVMVEGKWSLVWDPRDETQDPDDAATWDWSANQALCTLDALRQNPLRRYSNRNLWIETFAWGADVADEAAPTKAGPTRPRYETNGVLVFSQGAEIEDQVQPLADAGAARFTRVGGQLGFVPACWREPVMTLSDILDDQPFQFTRYRPSSELVTAVTANYISPLRAYEDSSTPIFTLAGAQAEDGGEEKRGPYDLRFCTDHRQAQCVAKIMGMRSRMQRTISGVFPPAAFDLVSGSIVNIALPAPYTGRNGIYEVESTNPAIDLLGQEGVALRCGLSLRETTAAVYTYDPATEEMDVSVEGFDPNIGTLQEPGTPVLTSGSGTVLISGDSMIARVLFTFDPSPSASVISYEWQFRRGSGLWQTGSLIDPETLTGGGDLFGYLVPVEIGQPYTIRVRAVAPGGASEWVESSAVTASAGSYLAPAPTPISAIGGVGEIAVTFQAPNDGDYRAMEIWGASIDDAGASSLLFGPIYGTANAIVTEIETALASLTTRYYFARSIDRNGSSSPYSASISATTT